jgi:ABC-type Fe3+-hydroxamate transport system substrate-binding protein
MLLVTVILAVVLVMVVSKTNELFEPNSKKLAMDVKNQFDKYVTVEKNIDRVVISSAEVVATENPGILDAVYMTSKWKAKLRARPKLITPSGTFVGPVVVIEGYGPSEDDAVYDAKRGMSIFRRDLQALYK